MPLYDFRCGGCEVELERPARIVDRHTQVCEECGGPLTLIPKPQPKYVPFHSYFDIGLGVEVTGRDHRRRVMRDNALDYRDIPRPGDRTARQDKIHERKREEARSRA